MKAIMISIKPKWVAKILNREKTIEIRKKFLKDYVGWVYIYCTKGNKHECLEYADNPNPNKEGKWVITSGYPYANGKIVARFWCDRVETIKEDKSCGLLWSQTMIEETLLKASCLTQKEMYDYLKKNKNGYAIRITDLEIFDKPKELKEFHYKRCEFGICHSCINYAVCNNGFEIPITKAPQSWCYIEVEEVD